MEIPLVPELSADEFRSQIIAARSPGHFAAPGVMVMLEELARRLSEDGRRVNMLNGMKSGAEGWDELVQLHEEQHKEILLLASALHLLPGQDDRGPPRLS